MILSTRQITQELNRLLEDDNFVLVVDENDNEYVIENICKRKLHTDDDSWCYALKIKKCVSDGCIKR